MHCPRDEQTNDRREASEELIDVNRYRAKCREEQEPTSVEVCTTTPLILMMVRTAGSERNNSLSGYHIADPSAARMTILSRRSESMEATRTR